MLFVGGSAQHLGGGSWSVGALANESFHQEFFEGVGVPTLHAAANKAGRNRSLEAGGGSAMRPAPPAPPRPLPGPFPGPSPLSPSSSYPSGRESGVALTYSATTL